MSLLIQQNVNLKTFNTFSVEAIARYFVELSDLAELPEALAFAKANNLSVFILGGGSNVVLQADLPYLVICIKTQGIQTVNESKEYIQLKVAAGENWHEFVRWTAKQNYYGLENLSLIPGTVGAAPVQNIGAYGVELKDCLQSLTAINLTSHQSRIFTRQDCLFAYRDSYFKQHPDQWLITEVVFELSKIPVTTLTYGQLQQRIVLLGIEKPTALDVSDAVCAIRTEKLPDPLVLPNGGSFFKNPEVTSQHAEQLKKRYPHLISYPLEQGRVKLAAGWLIEQAGWKGRSVGDAAVHQLQALVLVNKGQATGQQILDLATLIQADIKQAFDVELEIEPNILPRNILKKANGY